MLRTKKIQAFTISEMLVVLVIASIVISITLVVLNLVQSQIRSIQFIYKQNTEIQLLESTLWQDFNTYDLNFNKTSLELKGYSAIDSVVYVFKKDVVMRNKDTIEAPVYQIKTFFDGVEVKSGVIDAIEFQLSETVETKRLFIFKKNDAAHYLNE